MIIDETLTIDLILNKINRTPHCSLNIDKFNESYKEEGVKFLQEVCDFLSIEPIYK